MTGALGGVYDADGDGDFDVEDAKVLLGEWDLLVYVAFSAMTDWGDNPFKSVNSFYLSVFFNLPYLCSDLR